ELDLQRAAGAQPSLAGALVARADDDLAEALAGGARPAGHHLTEEGALHLLDLALTATGLAGAPAGARLAAVAGAVGADRGGVDRRSEEHTSELQSRFDLVCRLLLAQKDRHAGARPRPD